MPAAAIATLVLTGLLVAALAGYLIWVILIVRRIVASLGQVTDAVRAIADRTEPIGEVLSAVNADLAAVADALDGLSGHAESGVEAANVR